MLRSFLTKILHRQSFEERLLRARKETLDSIMFSLGDEDRKVIEKVLKTINKNQS